MNPFRSLFRAAPRKSTLTHRPANRLRVQLTLEGLETRLMPSGLPNGIGGIVAPPGQIDRSPPINPGGPSAAVRLASSTNLFVVPASQPADSTHFYTLAAAVAAATSGALVTI